MVVSIRVDDRLIHGQVALVWSKELNTPGIIVANDAACKNEMQKMTLKMAVPTGIKLLVRSIQDSIRILNSDNGKKMRIFVLVNCVKDALALVENVTEIETVNIANVGRFDGIDASEKVSLNGTIMLSKDELECAKKLVGYKVPVYHQLIPSSTKIPIKNLLASAHI